MMKEEGRRKREEGRGKREEGKCHHCKDFSNSQFLNVLAVAIAEF
jgi:hypothetical protein